MVPCFAEEIGTMGPMVVSDEVSGDFACARGEVCSLGVPPHDEAVFALTRIDRRRTKR